LNSKATKFYFKLKYIFPKKKLEYILEAISSNWHNHPKAHAKHQF